MNKTLSILMESCKSCSKAESYECGEQCSQFEDTLKGMGKVDCTIPADAVPIQKCETCDKEEGCCKESYMIDFNILSVYTEDNDYEDELAALKSLSEYYHIDMDEMVVVFESDNKNKKMIKDAKQHHNSGLVKKHNKALQNFKNHGIRVAKKNK